MEDVNVFITLFFPLSLWVSVEWNGQRNEQIRKRGEGMDWETDEEEEVMKASRESFIPWGMGGGDICSSFSGMSERENERRRDKAANTGCLWFERMCFKLGDISALILETIQATFRTVLDYRGVERHWHVFMVQCLLYRSWSMMVLSN